MANMRCVCVCMCRAGTGAKHNRGDEKNTTGLAHSRASRYHCVTNRKFRQRPEPAQARDGVRRASGAARRSAAEDAHVGASAFALVRVGSCNTCGQQTRRKGNE